MKRLQDLALSPNQRLALNEIRQRVAVSLVASDSLSYKCLDSPRSGNQTGLELNTRCPGETSRRLRPQVRLLQAADALAKAYRDSQQQRTH